MKIEVVDADYLNADHAQHIVRLLNVYATDPMGGGKALNENVSRNVVRELSKRPFAFSVLAYVDGQAVGLANCFESFSTFACKPIVNIHDIVVASEFRGYGLSQKMLKRVEELAVQKGCCKLTLEVLNGNDAAKSAYTKFGFAAYELDPKMGAASFWQKSLVGL